MAKATTSRATGKKTASAERPSSPLGRNLVILCDGTGNELGGALSDKESDIRISNVLKLYRIAEKGKRQLVYYTPGVGTVGRVDFLFRWKQNFLGFLGLTIGYGLDDNVLGAYRFLVENWEEGDRIYLYTSQVQKRITYKPFSDGRVTLTDLHVDLWALDPNSANPFFRRRLSSERDGSPR